jgi:hypothetical protein
MPVGLNVDTDRQLCASGWARADAPSSDTEEDCADDEHAGCNDDERDESAIG